MWLLGKKTVKKNPNLLTETQDKTVGPLIEISGIDRDMALDDL